MRVRRLLSLLPLSYTLLCARIRGWQNYVAYGCQNSVVVVDPQTVQVVQTLTNGTANITKVRWSKERYHHTLASPYLLRLASVNSSSLCAVWDVSQACVLAEFTLGQKQVHDIQWLSTGDSCRDLLAALIAPSQLCIWNADTGTKISTMSFGETVVSMAINPFDSSHFIVQTPEYLIMIRGYSPTSDDSQRTSEKFRLCQYPKSSTAHFPGKPNNFSQVKQLVPAALARDEDILLLTECLQMDFSPVQRGHLFLMFRREILILDLAINCTVGTIMAEKSTSSFAQLCPCWQRDVLYILHENGCCSFRMKDRLRAPPSLPASPGASTQRDDAYVTYAFSDPIRLGRSALVAGIALSPSSEMDVAVLVADGRTLIYKLEVEHCSQMSGSPATLYAQKVVIPPSLKAPHHGSVPDPTPSDGIPPISLDDAILPHWKMPLTDEMSLIQLPEDADQCCPVTLSFTLHGVLQNLLGSPTCIRMGPPVTTKNWTFHVPYLAVGYAIGSVQVVNLLTGHLYREVSVHTCPVGGVEWVNLSTIVSFAHTQPNSVGRVKNELAVTDLDTGAVHQLHKDRQGEPSPITLIRVSPLKCYLIVVFQARPMELWDVDTLSLLKVLHSIQIFFPVVEWIVTNHSRVGSGGGSKRLADSPDMEDLSLDKEKSPPHFTPEYLTLCGKDGSTYQLSVEGGKLKNLTQTPLHFGVNGIMSVTWKPELMVCGSADGDLVFYDVRNAQSRTHSTSRGVIKKVRFAPGKGNLKFLVLYNNRLEIRNALEDAVLAQIKWTKDQPSVDNAEWANSDKPVLLMSCGVVRVWDVSLKQCHAPMSTNKHCEPFFCPHSVLPHMALRLKTLLQHQPWGSGEYSLEEKLCKEQQMEQNDQETLQQFHVLPEEAVNYLTKAPLGTPQRCVYVAKLFGDEFEYRFWKVALHFMTLERLRISKSQYRCFKAHNRRKLDSGSNQAEASPALKGSGRHASTSSLRNVDDLLLVLDGLGLEDRKPEGDNVFSFDDEPLPTAEELKEAILEAEEEHSQAVSSLDLSYDLLMPNTNFKKLELHRTSLHDRKRLTYELTSKCASRLLFLGQTDRAVQLLLETESTHPCYYSDSLKACLATAIDCNATSQSTVKLVSTNLIANGKLIEGAQLLCMTGKGLDACRYLQTYGDWTAAAWLAKVCLSDKDCQEVFSRWVDHLMSPHCNQKQFALLLLLSMGMFDRVVEMLYNMRYFDIAAIFVDCCQQWGILDSSDLPEDIAESVYLEYARYLQSLGLSSGLRHYCSLAGERGKQLLEQFIAATASGQKKV